tara:strand:- start:48 stop:512 length:465 start_codon:yes stop_codon:yes gene_type:complete
MSCPNCGCSGGGRRKRRSKSKRSRSNRKSRIALPLRYFGVGGSPALPSEYFGGDSGRYLAAGNSNLNPCPLNVPTSHGTLTGDGLMGPDLHPGPYPTGNQTAGSRSKRRSRRSRRKSKRRIQRKSSRRSQRKSTRRSQRKSRKHNQRKSRSNKN